MSNVLLFSVGAVVFIFLTGATILFLYFRFREVYRVDQAADAQAPAIVTDGNTEIIAARETVVA